LPLLIVSFLALVATWIGLDLLGSRSARHVHPTNLDRLLALPLAMMGLLDEAPALAPTISDGLKRARIIVSGLAQHLPSFQAMNIVFQSEGVQRADRLAGWMRIADARRGAPPNGRSGFPISE
jgi:hypothetical protein